MGRAKSLRVKRHPKGLAPADSRVRLSHPTPQAIRCNIARPDGTQRVSRPEVGGGPEGARSFRNLRKGRVGWRLLSLLRIGRATQEWEAGSAETSVWG